MSANGDLLMPEPGPNGVLAVDTRPARQDAPVAASDDDGCSDQESHVCDCRESRRGTHRAEQRHRSEPEKRHDEHVRQGPDCHWISRAFSDAQSADSRPGSRESTQRNSRLGSLTTASW